MLKVSLLQIGNLLTLLIGILSGLQRARLITPESNETRNRGHLPAFIWQGDSQYGTGFTMCGRPVRSELGRPRGGRTAPVLGVARLVDSEGTTKYHFWSVSEHINVDL